MNVDFFKSLLHQEDRKRPALVNGDYDYYLNFCIAHPQILGD